ncbi:hypothetical protein EYD10_18330, partial [Varanus komodoensis]
MATLSLSTWNTRGLRQPKRREEIIPQLAKLPYDITVLQETHICNEQQRSHAQRLWSPGPSVWSYGEECGAGVAVLFREKHNLHIDNILEALPGRLIVIDFSLKDLSADGLEISRPFRFCGLYAPVDSSQRKGFWENLKNFCSTQRRLIIAGDFNNRTKLSDRIRAVNSPARSSALALSAEERDLEKFLMSQGLRDKALEVPNTLNFFSVPCRKALLDTFPTTDGVRFTYYSGKTASRLDRFRAPKEVKTEKCNIVITPWSDHTILAVELSFGQVYPRGRPLWRLRPKMLDAPCRDNMANVLANMLTLSDIYFDELPEWWERTKRAIRNSCRKYEFKVNRRGLQHYQEAVFHFLQCHSRMNQGRPYDEGVLVRSRKVIAEFHYTQRRNRLNYRDYRVKGSAVDVEEWAKARSPKTPIEMKGLREKEGDAVAFHPQEMLSIMGRYYQQLFAPKDIDSREVDCFLEDIPREKAGSLYGKLTEAESQMLEAPIVEEEVRRAIVTAKGNSAPGADGLGYEFYKIFREWLVPPLTKVFNSLLAREQLTESFYQGTLIFFPKKGDLTLPANWRPIALTNMDYRLLAKILKRRLASVAHKLVVGCQTSAVPGRAMTDSLCLMREIFQLVRDRKWAGRILLLDQSKAFDNVHHSFLWRVLRRKGLPPSYVGFLKLLYAEATVTPQINGHRGSRIDLQSG